MLSYEANDSPFPEVRAVIPPGDDLSMPVNTVRVWTIGLIFTIVSGFDIYQLTRQSHPSRLLISHFHRWAVA